jgi:hypothetical protein
VAAFYSNGKIKPNRCVIGGKEEGHLEGAWLALSRRTQSHACFNQWLAD